MASTSSSRVIQLHHCRPEPNRPPSPSRNSGSSLGRAPPSAVKTTPVRMVATRMPASAAGAVGRLPGHAHPGQEVVTRAARLVEHLVAAVAVVADGRAADQHRTAGDRARPGSRPAARCRGSGSRAARACARRSSAGRRCRRRPGSRPRRRRPARRRRWCRPPDPSGAPTRRRPPVGAPPGPPRGRRPARRATRAVPMRPVDPGDGDLHGANLYYRRAMADDGAVPWGVEKKRRRRGRAPALHHQSAGGGGLVAVLVVLVLQNTNNANLHLLLFTVAYPMWLVLGGIMVVSFLAGWLFGGDAASRSTRRLEVPLDAVAGVEHVGRRARRSRRGRRRRGRRAARPRRPARRSGGRRRPRVTPVGSCSVGDVRVGRAAPRRPARPAGRRRVVTATRGRRRCSACRPGRAAGSAGR